MQNINRVTRSVRDKEVNTAKRSSLWATMVRSRFWLRLWGDLYCEQSYHQLLCEKCVRMSVFGPELRFKSLLSRGSVGFLLNRQVSPLLSWDFVCCRTGGCRDGESRLGLSHLPFLFRRNEYTVQENTLATVRLIDREIWIVKILVD